MDRIQLASWFSLNYIEFSQRPMNYLFKDTAAGSKSLVLSVNAHPGPHLTGGLCKVVEELSRICPPASQIFFYWILTQILVHFCTKFKTKFYNRALVRITMRSSCGISACIAKDPFFSYFSKQDPHKSAVRPLLSLGWHIWW